jgi:predicted porin
MNKNIKLAVAGAVLVLSDSAANAGIVIPAGDWTLDVSGNVNMYTSWAKASKSTASDIVGGLTTSTKNTVNTMGNGLLPNFLSFSGSTRQNDLDVSFTISLQPGSAQNHALNQVGSNDGAALGQPNGGLNNRQSFITVGDKSWGSVKMGKDLGIFASDAILSDMTLLGVGGASAGAAGNTSLGRIGYGYIYADWKPQISYTTPNFNGVQATVGITKAFVSTGASSESPKNNYGAANANVAYEGKASYSFAANDVTGKVWVSGIAQHIAPFVGDINGDDGSNHAANSDPMAYAGDIGAKLSASGFDLVGYYYAGTGIGTTGQFMNGYGLNHDSGKWEGRDSYGGYVQAMYTLPTKTKVGVSWGTSRLDTAANEGYYSSRYTVKENEMWDLMVQHPLTKHLNLIAEYSNQKSSNQRGDENEANVGSLGAILFF